jgi:hypothetical protein
MTDMEIDFDRQGQVVAASEPPIQPQAALPAPADKLSSLEDQIMNGATKRAVTPRAQAAPSPALPDDAPMIDRAIAALEREGSGHRWLQALVAATTGTVETAGDLGRLRTLPSVVNNLKTAPPAIRSRIEELFAQAGQRLAEPVDEAAADPANEGKDAWADPAQAAE